MARAFWFFHFVRVAWKCWRLAGENGSAYQGVNYRGVPQLTIHIATGREAWRTVDHAISSNRLRITSVPEK